MELLTVQEIAALLKVNPETVRRHIASGRLQAVRIGRHVRVRREAIDAMVIPIAPKEGAQMRGAMPIYTMQPTSLPTEAQLRKRQQAIIDSEALLARMRHRLAGKPLEPSWPIIRAARQERSDQL